MAVGIQPTPSSGLAHELAAAAAELGRNPLEAVAAVAEAMANTTGATLAGAGLRLDSCLPTDPELVTGVAGPWELDPHLLGRLYELMIAPDMRRRSGTHLTPESLSWRLTGCLDVDWGHASVLDPAVGGGSFLLAAAERARLAGRPLDDTLHGLHGVDIDADALAVAEAALNLWALAAARADGNDQAPQALPKLRHGDGLLDEMGPVDAVIGNPPFLSQLRSASARDPDRRSRVRDRWGELVGAYTDDAWLFVVAALRAVRPGGYVSLVQPTSLLAAAHADAIRAEVRERASLTGIWLAGQRMFDAHVQVCAPVIVAAEAATESVARWYGPDFEQRPPMRAPQPGTTWGPIAAEMRGVPLTRIGLAAPAPKDRTIASIADATAGFRDQFYGFVPHLVDDAAVAASDDGHALVTVGMIDPFVSRWGTAEFRFAGQRVQSPAVRLTAIEAADPPLARWVRARQRPKVLLATQTRVVEAWVDLVGRAIPVTPVISVEPHDPADVWRLAAAVSAPAVTALALSEGFGTALSLDALKLSARRVESLPLPKDREAWQAGAEALEQLRSETNGPRRGTLLQTFADAMDAAYGSDAGSWWLDRIGETAPAEQSPGPTLDAP